MGAPTAADGLSPAWDNWRGPALPQLQSGNPLAPWAETQVGRGGYGQGFSTAPVARGPYDDVGQTTGSAVADLFNTAASARVQRGTDPIGDLIDEMNARTAPSSGVSPNLAPMTAMTAAEAWAQQRRPITLISATPDDLIPQPTFRGPSPAPMGDGAGESSAGSGAGWSGQVDGLSTVAMRSGPGGAAEGSGFQVSVGYGPKSEWASKHHALRWSVQGQVQKIYDWLSAHPNETFSTTANIYHSDGTWSLAGRLTVTAGELARGIRSTYITLDDVPQAYDFPKHGDPTVREYVGENYAFTTDLTGRGKYSLSDPKIKFWTSYNAPWIKDNPDKLPLLILHEVTRTTPAFNDPAIDPNWHLWEDGQRAAGPLDPTIDKPESGIAQQVLLRMRQKP